MLLFVSEYIHRRQGANHELLRHILQIYDTTSYTGNLTPGAAKVPYMRPVPVAAMPPAIIPDVPAAENSLALQSVARIVLDFQGYNSDHSSNDPEDDEEAQDNVSGVYNFYT